VRFTAQDALPHATAILIGFIKNVRGNVSTKANEGNKVSSFALFPSVQCGLPSRQREFHRAAWLAFAGVVAKMGQFLILSYCLSLPTQEQIHIPRCTHPQARGDP